MECAVPFHTALGASLSCTLTGFRLIRLCAAQPYPANLMVGFYATGDSSAPLRTDLDNELEGETHGVALSIANLSCVVWPDAKWYTREELLSILNHPEGTNITRNDHRKLAASQEEKRPLTSTANALAGDAVTEEEKKAKAVVEGPSELKFRVPPVTAIAGVLISEWAHGRAGPQPGHTGQMKL